MNKLSLSIALIAGITTLASYAFVNYLYFGDWGFVEAGRIVFASKYGYFDYLILPAVIFLGMLEFRKRFSTNNSFKSFFRFGLKTTLIAASIFSTFIFTWLHFVEPDYFFQLIGLLHQLDVPGRELSGMETGMLAQAKLLEETPLFRSAYFYAPVNFLVYFVLGTATSLIFALVFREKKPSMN